MVNNRGGKLKRSRTVTVRLDPATYALATEAAWLTRRTLSSLIHCLLEEHSARLIEKYRPLFEERKKALDLISGAREKKD